MNITPEKPKGQQRHLRVSIKQVPHQVEEMMTITGMSDFIEDIKGSTDEKILYNLFSDENFTHTNSLRSSTADLNVEKYKREL